MSPTSTKVIHIRKVTAHTRAPSILEAATCPTLNNGQSHLSPLLPKYRPLCSAGLKVYKQSKTSFLQPVPHPINHHVQPPTKFSEPPGGLVRSPPPTYSTAVLLQSWHPGDSARCWPSTVRGRRRPSTQLPPPPQSTSLCHHLSQR